MIRRLYICLPKTSGRTPGARIPVEAGPALLTVVALRVVLAARAHARVRVTAARMPVALAGHAGAEQLAGLGRKSVVAGRTLLARRARVRGRALAQLDGGGHRAQKAMFILQNHLGKEFNQSNNRSINQ
jgi:hypothetical protein